MSYIPDATANYAGSGNIKTTVVTVSVTILLSLYAIKTHIITDAFVSFMSLFFDKFSLHASNSISDLILLVMAVCTGYGAYYIITKRYEVIAILAAIGIFVAVMGV